MNALYELSKLYAQEKISKDEYRSRRAELVNAIISGHESCENSTTVVPSASEKDEITQHPPNSSQSEFIPKRNVSVSKKDTDTHTKHDKPLSINSIRWFAVILVILFIMLYFVLTPSLEEQLSQNSNHTTIIQENVDEDPTMQELNNLWETILKQKQITQNDNQQLESIWGMAPANVKARFIGDLKETISLWEEDFEKEIEMGLTTQLLAELESEDN